MKVYSGSDQLRRSAKASHEMRHELRYTCAVLFRAEDRMWSLVAALFFLGSGIALAGKGAHKGHHGTDFVVGDVAFEARHVAFSRSDGLDKFSVRFALDCCGPQIGYLQAFSHGSVAAAVLAVAGGALGLKHIRTGCIALTDGWASSHREGNNQRGDGHPGVNEW